jgi:hypothetical protein
MPTISNNSVRVWNKEIDKTYDIVIKYNQKHHFYTNIPESFKEIVHHLTDDEREKMFIQELVKGPYGSNEYEQIISGETESECLGRIKDCLTVVVDKALVQKKVIIVFYDGADTVTYNNHRYNNEHPQIGLKFGLTYAIETSVGDKKVYSTYTTRRGIIDDKEIVERHELSLWNKAATIIPDTEENRNALELLYTNLNILNEKMKEFTSTPVRMLEFIATNVKMLTQ